jgi:hypothetical protein
MRGWSCSGLDSVSKCWRYYFQLSNAFCCSVPQSTFVEPLNTLKKGRLLSASFAMNLFKAVIQSVNFLFPILQRLHLEDCISFVGVGLDAFGGDQTTGYLASCYFEDTFLRVELEIGFTHIGESLCQAGDV